MPRQIEIIQELIDDAVSKGAKVLAGGRKNPQLTGNFWEPTLLADVNHSMRIMKEEHFGMMLMIPDFHS